MKVKCSIDEADDIINLVDLAHEEEEASLINVLRFDWGWRLWLGFWIRG